MNTFYDEEIPAADENGEIVTVISSVNSETSNDQVSIEPEDFGYSENKVILAINSAIEGECDGYSPVDAADIPAHVMTSAQRRILDMTIPVEAYNTTDGTTPFIPAWVIDHVAGKVFEDHWNTEIVKSDIVFDGRASIRIPARPGKAVKMIERPIHRVIAQATVRVTVVGPDGKTQSHSAVGVSSYDEAPEVADGITAYRIAIKGAVTDARRTALQHFGRIFAPIVRDRDALAETLQQHRLLIEQAHTAADEQVPEVVKTTSKTAGSGVARKPHPLDPAPKVDPMPDTPATQDKPHRPFDYSALAKKTAQASSTATTPAKQSVAVAPKPVESAPASKPNHAALLEEISGLVDKADDEDALIGLLKDRIVDIKALLSSDDEDIRTEIEVVLEVSGLSAKDFNSGK